MLYVAVVWCNFIDETRERYIGDHTSISYVFSIEAKGCLSSSASLRTACFRAPRVFVTVSEYSFRPFVSVAPFCSPFPIDPSRSSKHIRLSSRERNQCRVGCVSRVTIANCELRAREKGLLLDEQQTENRRKMRKIGRIEF